MSVVREVCELGFAERLILLLTTVDGRLRLLPGSATRCAFAAVVLLELEEIGLVALDERSIVTVRRFDIGNFSPDRNLRDIFREISMRGSMPLKEWLVRVAARADGMIVETVGRLRRAELLVEKEERKLFFVRRRYSSAGCEGMELRRSLLDILSSESEPSFHAIRFICLADGLGLFRLLLTDEERSAVRDRIAAVRRMDEVGYRLALALEDLAPVMRKE